MRTYGEMLEHASKLHKAGNFQEAEGAYLQLLTANPEDPLVLFLLGTLLSERKVYGLAITLLGKALERGLPPEYAPQALNNLGASFRGAGHREPGIRTYAKAVELAPNEGSYYGNWASLYINEGEPERAEELCRHALELMPEGHPHTEWNLALALLEQGKYEEGWRYYRRGVDAGLRSTRHFGKNGAETPWWDGESHVGTLCIYGEQGLGDEVMFASTFREVFDKADNVVIDCTPRLKETFARSFPEATVFSSDDEGWWEDYDIDAKILMGDVAGLCRPDEESFPKPGTPPYLRPPVNFAIPLESDKPKIGLLWKGGTRETNERDRSLGLEAMKPLLDLDAEFISLQYTPGAEEMAKQHGVHHWQNVIDDLDMQISLIDQLDLVVGCCGSAIHFAGALGKPCIVLAPKKVRWCYGQTGERMDWYPSVTVLRQENEGDWEPAVKEATKRVADFLELREAEPATVRGAA